MLAEKMTYDPLSNFEILHEMLKLQDSTVLLNFTFYEFLREPKTIKITKFLNLFKS
jgi:hypothetical protein